MIHSQNARDNQEWNQHRFLSPAGCWSTGSASMAINSDGSKSLVIGVNIQSHYASTMSVNSLQLDSSQQPMRRRSHRPRGCRGGRKNRKVKGSSTTNNDCSSPQSPLRVHHSQNVSDDYDMTKANTGSKDSFSFSSGSSPMVKGDLSPYQHVKVSNSWNFGSQNYNNAPIPTARCSQMLPPPVPSALFDCHRQMEMNTGEIGLKMLPSFDNDFDEDSDDSAEGSLDVPPPPPPFHRRAVGHPNKNEEWCDATANATVSTSHCYSTSDDSDASSTASRNRGMHHHHSIKQRKYSLLNPTQRMADLVIKPPLPTVSTTTELEGGSLFVTSPRSFLLGITTAAAMLHNPRQGKGLYQGPTMGNASKYSNLKFEPTRNASQTKLLW